MGSVISEIEIDGYADDQVGYHSYLIIDAGLAKGVDVTTLNDETPRWQILYLTWTGHDFADAARNETTWKKATGMVKDKAGSATFEIFKEVLVSVIKGNIGIP
jgi:hypothetical protein